jgi:hypothetical protein
MNRNDIDGVMDDVAQGKIPANMANVRLVQIQGVRIVKGVMPRRVRKELMAAVKSGELGHLRKDGHKPEAFFHKNAMTRAIAERNEIERNITRSVMTVFVKAGAVGE